MKPRSGDLWLWVIVGSEGLLWELGQYRASSYIRVSLGAVQVKGSLQSLPPSASQLLACSGMGPEHRPRSSSVPHASLLSVCEMNLMCAFYAQLVSHTSWGSSDRLNTGAPSAPVPRNPVHHGVPLSALCLGNPHSNSVYLLSASTFCCPLVFTL